MYVTVDAIPNNSLLRIIVVFIRRRQSRDRANVTNTKAPSTRIRIFLNPDIFLLWV